MAPFDLFTLALSAAANALNLQAIHKTLLPPKLLRAEPNQRWPFAFFGAAEFWPALD